MNEGAAGPRHELLSERYRILHEIGRGGMAAVYLAEDVKHHRQVAVKVMRQSTEDGIIDRQRFLREIEVAARLSHPHIVPLFDSGAAGDDLFYVMPYVAGETLRGRLSHEGPLPIDHALRLGREIASALGYAHAQGLIHRDLKPENILLADGIPLVADFGIARAIVIAAGDQTRGGTTRGVVVGTPAYMSPEQACGEQVDQRSDVYSLGCVLFEMLVGRPPFLGGSAHELVRQHMVDKPPLVESIRADVPHAVSIVVERALAKRPNDRHATALHFAEALAAAAAGAQTPEPVAAAEHAPPHNLPTDRTQFIGRAQELAACARLMADTRLLTLTAIGGCGKTRLALKLGERLLPSVSDGVWFVDLAPVREHGQVVHAIAGALSVRESADRDLLQSVVEWLANKQTIVLLDNCEHLLEAVRPVVDRLLRSRDVRVLATSREALGVDGERLFAVGPLGVPPRGPVRVSDAAPSEAVALFLDRARRLVSDVELTAGNAEAIAEICRRLDGIPLAIELAAARIKVLSVVQIRDRLGDALQLLTSGSARSVGRHQTLEATIAWSYDQLASEEQRLFRTLAVFSGGWSFESVCRLMHGQDEFLLLNELSHLIDKSLVIVDRRRGGEPRYTLLEPVRQFANRRLIAGGELEAARARHADEFLAMAERAHAARLDDEDRWLATLSVEHDNLRTALDYFRATDPERHLQMAGALAWFWIARSHLVEGRDQIASALRATDATHVRRARARAVAGAAAAYAWLGDAAAAADAWSASLNDWRAIGDELEIAMTLEGTGWAHFMTGNDEEAYATFKEMLGLQHVKGHAHLSNRANLGVGQLAVALGYIDEARTCSREILRHVETYPNSRSEHLAYHYLADCALLAERFEESLPLYRRSLELALVLGDHLEIGFEIQGVAMSLAGRGANAEALRLAEAVEAEFVRLGVDLRVRFWNALLDRHLGSLRRDKTRVDDVMTFDAAVQLALQSSTVNRL